MGGDEDGSTTDRTLAAMLRDEPVTIGDAVRIATAVADRVVALHARGRALGGLGPDTVVVAGDGSVSLTGVPAPQRGATAPAELRADDLRGVGLVLAAGLGWTGDGLPAPIERLVSRASEADAPASALALALQRLQRDPLAVAALLPPAAAPAARASGLHDVIGLLVPSRDRRTAGLAAVALGGVAALGAVLLLIGTPGSTGTTPRAAQALDVRPDPVASAPVAAAAPTSVDALLHPARPSGPSAARPRVVRQQPVAAVEAPVEVAGPTVPPTGTPTAVPTSSTPTASAPVVAAPTPTAAPPTAAPPSAPTDPPTEPPAPPSTAPEPSAPPVTPPAAPSAPPSAQPDVLPSATPTG